MSSARDEISRLVYEYAERIDGGDFKGVAGLFADAAITVEGIEGETRGRDEVLALYRRTTRIHEDTGTPRTRHLTTNLIVDFDEDGDRAEARCTFTVLQQTPKLALQPIVTGRYRDRFERVDGRWRFAHRHMILDQLGDLSQHLLFDTGRLGSED